MAAKGTLERARGALRSPDFRRLLFIRLASQFGDGLFQVSLIASVVFSPDEQSTTVGLFKAHVDRRRSPSRSSGRSPACSSTGGRAARILTIAPWVKTGSSGSCCSTRVRRADPVLRGRAARAVGQPLLPGDRAGGRAAARPHRGPADRELARDRGRHGRAPRRHLPGRPDRRHDRHASSPSSARARCGWSVRGIAVTDPERPGPAHAARGSGAAPPRAAAGRRRVHRRDRAPVAERLARSDRSRRSRSTSWDRGSCSRSRSSCSGSASARASVRSPT